MNTAISQSKYMPKHWRWRKNPHQNRNRIVYDWVLINTAVCPIERLAVVLRPPCLWHGWSVYIGSEMYRSKFKTLKVAKDFAVLASISGRGRK